MLSPEGMEEPVEAIMERWLKLHQEGNFSACNVREYWQSAVPCIYAPQLNVSALHSMEKEEQGAKLLLEPLHTFITGTPDHQPIYKGIRELDKAPSLCGRVFNSGEPTYGCRDCGFDPTCVLCPDCFKASPHTKHRYTMSTSSGGGYCDCGDIEAWKEGAYCDVHVKGHTENTQCSHAELEASHPDMVSRLLLLMECILDYAMEVLPHNEGMALSKDLELPDAEPTRNSKLYQMRDNFCAVLYNDESHTYEQVISSLERAIKCSKKEAVAYVTYIDRAGRCVIKCSGLQQCQAVKGIMDRQAHYLMANPFVVKIYRAHVQAHQAFATHLLTWLDKLLEKGSSIKSMFAQIMFSVRPGKTMSTVEHVMWMDHELFKSARMQWHKLFISGLLMDMETKKRFARLFTKHYCQMMKSFISDDHEHSVCIVSLGVQLFTMPTIAHLLIAEEAVIAKIILTFMAEVNSRIKNGKLVPLSQNASVSSLPADSMSPVEFKRVQFVLFDMRYLLGMVPVAWTDQLRKGFLHGFSLFLKLLILMQNMDPVVRKEGSHVEFEQEWEGSFNLHIKLSPLLPQIVDWAASDRVVLIKCMRMLHKSLSEHGCEGLQKRFMREAAGCTVSCIEYDVSKSPVSMHAPLTRLCGYMSASLQKYDLTYSSVPEFPVKDKPSLKELVEPTLRTLVMVAQCKAGMWRRNGMSLTNQTYFYRNVRCRKEMWDRDLMVVQCAASLMDPNEFLITLLNRFSLMSWQRADYESTYMWGHDDDNVRQTVVVLEEMLQLLLHVLSERYTAGIGTVSQDDIIRHEVTQLLCIQDMTHSNINNLLTERSNHETGMENIIDHIADFKKSSEDAKGFYQLKSNHYKYYNVYFYHYSKEDQSKSEVQHRERCKRQGELYVCCPPPPPPPFTDAYAPSLQLLNCAVFRHVVTQLVTRWCDGRSASVTEGSMRVCLHLLGVACHEEARTKGFMSNPQQLLDLLQQMQDADKSEPIMPLVNWIKAKLQSVLSPSQDDPQAASAPCQHKQAAPDGGVQDGAEKLRKAGEALARRKRILDKMANMQQNFMKTHLNLFTEEGDGSITEDTKAGDSSSVSMDTRDVTHVDLVALGPAQTLPQGRQMEQTCIVCHQDEVLCTGDSSKAASGEGDGSSEGRLLVVGVMVQASTVLARGSTSLATDRQPLYLPSDLQRGIHVSSCGHPMHVDCWKLYYTKLIQREQRRTFRFRTSLNFDIERSEFLCPLCECVCNDAVALLPATTQPIVAGCVERDTPNLQPHQWLHGLAAIVDNKGARSLSSLTVASSPPDDETASCGGGIQQPQQPEPAVAGVWLPPQLATLQAQLQADKVTDQAAEENNFTELFCSPYNMARPSLLAGADDVIWDVAHSIFRHGLDQNPNHDDERILGSVLVSLAYTIRCFEVTQRFAGRALLTNLTDRNHLFLATLTATAAYMPSTVAHKQAPAVSSSACVSVLADVLGCSSIALLEVDAFSALVSLTLLLPTLFSTTHATAKGGLQDFYLLHLLFFGHVIQLLLTYDSLEQQTTEATATPTTERKMRESPTLESTTHTAASTETQSTISISCDDTLLEEMDCDTGDDITDSSGGGGDVIESDGAWLLRLLRRCRQVVGSPDVPVTEEALSEYIVEKCLPFLRCCGLFYHVLTGCDAPEELRSSVWVPESEHFCLLRYMGLQSSLAASLRPYEAVLDKWLSHPRLRKVHSRRLFDGHQTLHIRRLAPLTTDYSELITDVSAFICPSSAVGEKSTTPTICLVCGATMCSQTYCCQTELHSTPRQIVGSTTLHARSCGAGSAMFLRVGDCKVILRTGRSRGCYYAPPYLDQYGETDQGLRRGNPLFLNKEHHHRLHTIWLHHLLPETISRVLVPTTSIPTNIDWQHL